ncbi:MAG: glycosyltransferase [Actinomycetota bacterium]|nr:glycosyltransferase [Actinomycetota bacterium]
MTARPQLSVVVPFHERQDQLDRLLAGLDRQRLEPDRFELVVADDGSQHAPVVGARRYATRVVRQHDAGFRAAAARNLGARAAVGDVIAFLDQDCVPALDYLQRVAAAAVSPWSLVLGHRLHTDLGGWSGDAVGSWLSGTGAGPPILDEPQWLLDGYARTHDLTEPDPRAYQLVISAVLSMHRDLFDALDGFDESFQAYGGEDWELGHRALVAGADTQWLAEAVAWHDGPDLAGRAADTRDTVEAKNAETLTLAALVPDRDLRGEHLIWGVPDIVVRLSAGGASVATLLASVESLLAGSDAQVWVNEPDAGGRLVATVTDPRIHVGEPQPDVLARARYQVVCDPVLLDGTTLRALCRLAPVATPGLRLTLRRDDTRSARGLPRVADQPWPVDAHVRRLRDAPALERMWQSRPTSAG